MPPGPGAALATGPVEVAGTGARAVTVINGNISHPPPARAPSTTCVTRARMCALARRGRPRIREDVTFRSVWAQGVLRERDRHGWGTGRTEGRDGRADGTDTGGGRECGRLRTPRARRQVPHSPRPAPHPHRPRPGPPAAAPRPPRGRDRAARQLRRRSGPRHPHPRPGRALARPRLGGRAQDGGGREGADAAAAADRGAGPVRALRAAGGRRHTARLRLPEGGLVHHRGAPGTARGAGAGLARGRARHGGAHRDAPGASRDPGRDPRLDPADPRRRLPGRPLRPGAPALGRPPLPRPPRRPARTHPRRARAALRRRPSDRPPPGFPLLLGRDHQPPQVVVAGLLRAGGPPGGPDRGDVVRHHAAAAEPVRRLRGSADQPRPGGHPRHHPPPHGSAVLLREPVRARGRRGDRPGRRTGRTPGPVPHRRPPRPLRRRPVRRLRRHGGELARVREGLGGTSHPNR
ncbi:putative Peptidase [Streptomyces misionensis JCM 4497]